MDIKAELIAIIKKVTEGGYPGNLYKNSWH